ncbi:virulence-associated E family protein [Aeromonas veronii]|uniref:virulence-associated E family protein n=1 Tax=Aeromonas veronii TaxID=654 RepID=UPI001F31B8D5|nr:virulence-associated E family protein [Aeromonas veronii]
MKQSNETIFECELLTYDQQDQKNNEQQDKNVVFAKVMDNSKQLTLPDLLPNSRPMRTSRNLHAIILHKNWIPRFNQMTAEPEVANSDNQRLGLSDAGQRSALVDACQHAHLSDRAIDDHLTAICEQHSYHPVRSWLEDGMPWDGQLRVDKVIATLGAVNPGYAAQVINPWLIGCVAALYEPNWISKLVPVLAGGQSFKKSAWIRHIATVVPGSTLDCSINPDVPDDVRRAVSAWVVELAELESTTRHEAGSLKAFLTRDHDRFRVPYGRNFTVKRRQTSFIGTVNGTGFLKDATGSSRFAVIELASPANMDVLNEILGWSWDEGRVRHTEPEKLRQFWLEVKAKYDDGGSWYLDETTVIQAASVNDAHTDKGAWYDIICHHYLSGEYNDTKWVVASELCKLHGEKVNMATSCGKALRMLASEGKIKSKKGRSNQTLYCLPVIGTNRIDKVIK